MGAVYRATHLGTKRTVAVKIIHPQFSNNEEFVERFRREAEASGRLRHPNVVDVTDFGFARTGSGQVAYLVMEYLDGCTLAEILEEEQRLSPSWVVDILDQVCSAVEEAHRLGIIHRDLKPENIWLEPNRRGGYTVKVLDFGLAKLGDRAEPSAAAAAAAASATAAESMTLAQPSYQTIGAGLTRIGSVMGTPLYMSPEQCRGERPDARSDISRRVRAFGRRSPSLGERNRCRSGWLVMLAMSGGAPVRALPASASSCRARRRCINC